MGSPSHRTSKPGAGASGGDRLLATNSATAALQWDNLLELQVAQFLPHELAFLLSSRSWMNARRVLDIGCGNGYYLSHLIRYFPHKSYVGIDVSAEMIASARANPALADAKLWQVDLGSYESAEHFDAVVLRLVVQHLHGFDELLASLARLVAPGGAVFIIEAEPSAFRNHPATPKFERLLSAYGTQAARLGKNRAIVEGMAEIVRSSSNFGVIRDELQVMPQVGPFTSSPLMQIFSIWLDIFERSGAVSADYAAVRDELERWSAAPEAFNQVGVRFIELVNAPARGPSPPLA